MLSPVDVGGGHAFGTLRAAAELTNIRRGMRPRFWMVKDYKVKGLLLERWFLKTMINLACLGDDHVVWEDGAARDQPPAMLVDYCYGEGVLSEPRGLYALGAVGMDIQETESVTFSPVFREAHLVAGIFLFRGYHFLLSVSDDPLLKVWAEAGGALRGKAASLLYHPKAFEADNGGRRSHIVKYTWR